MWSTQSIGPFPAQLPTTAASFFGVLFRTQASSVKPPV